MSAHAAPDPWKSPEAELFVLSGPDVGRSFPVRHGSTVGRAPDRDVPLRDRSISRHHAHFECQGEVWQIVDDGSTNGFFVDGARSKRAAIAELREFLIGEVLVRLRTSSAAPSPALEASSPAAPSVAQGPPGEPDEIVLEDEIQLDRPASVPRAPTAPEPAAAPVVPEDRAAARRALLLGQMGAAGAGQASNARILQYHKQPARRGLFVTDLSQQPGWVRGLAVLLALALFAALAWGAYVGVLAVRERGAATSDPAEE